jgi:hypothetical protein
MAVARARRDAEFDCDSLSATCSKQPDLFP